MAGPDDDKIVQLVIAALGKFTDQQNKQAGIWSSVKDFIGTLANFIQVAGWVVPALSSFVGLLKGMGLNSSDNLDIVTQMQNDLDRAIGDILKGTKMDDIAKVLGAAQAGLKNIQQAPAPDVPPEIFTPGTDSILVNEAIIDLTS